MIDRITPTHRPRGRATGRQRWLDLTFLHWRVPAATLLPLVPQQLTIDEFDGSAWVALVPFRMEGVRPWWSPPVPGLSAFAETNVRTYVHRDGQDPGVWFFSLEAANRIAVWLARNFWHLNYQYAHMSFEQDGDKLTYTTRRVGPDHAGVGGRVTVRVEAPIDQRGPGGWGTAEPGTMEHFLAERYLLYTTHPRGHLIRGRVHHPPYPLRQAVCLELIDNLVRTAGVEMTREQPDHVLFSGGVDVQVYSLEHLADGLVLKG